LIPGSDTAKQDLTLVIVGAVAALLFYWLYTDVHPLSSADNSYGKGAAENRAAEIAEQFGFQTDESPVTTFRAQSSLLDSLQKQTVFKEFYSNPLNKSFYPVFYWQTTFKMEPGQRVSAFGFDEEPAKTVDIHLSEEGKLIALRNNHEILPLMRAEHEVLAHALQIDLIPSIHLSDTSRAPRFRFQFTGAEEQNFDNAEIFQQEALTFGESVAERMAAYYLEESGWPGQHFSSTSTELVSLEDNVDAARVTFSYESEDLRQSANIYITILPTGNLLAMDYSHPNMYDFDVNFNVIKSGFRAILILFGFFWIVILLFVRFRLRLIDMKGAVLIAVLAGLIFPFLLILEQLYTHIYSFGEVNFSFLVRLMVPVGFFAAITSLGYFSVTAISDSITRQNWNEKLRTADLLRVGHFNNIPVGLNLIRGISYGFVVAVIWCVTLWLIPGTFITLESSLFRASESFLPYVKEIIGNLAIYFLVTQIFFLIIVGQIRSSFKSPVILILAPAVLFSLSYPITFEVGATAAELISAGVVGLGAGWIYYREDFLTTFISLFVFVTFVSTSSGWLIGQSPDAMTFYTFLVLIIAGFIYGSYNIYRGKPVKELPEYVPDYIHELAQEDRIKQELQIARKVQQSFLPARTPEVEGLDIAAICKPAYETGGDYYDFIRFDDGRLAVAIGDVSGKGIQAAFFMTFTKGVLHALCNDLDSTIEILSKTNKMFRKNANKGTFISLIFGVLDTHNSSFRFSRAGHNPLLFFDSKNKKLHEFQPDGIAIGMAEEDVFRKNINEKEIHFSKHDILILFTDGVVESISKTNKLYGDHRLHNLIKKYHHLPAKELITKLEEDLERFGEKTEQHDDLTMIVIKKK
jgi:phosphoserine phosphatase RsbU/P